VTRLRILALLAALVPAHGWAQTAQTARPPDACTIEGVVLGEGSGQPLGKARAVVSSIDTPDAVFSIVTSADGRFAISDIPPGRYRLSVTREGYVSQEYGQRNSGQPGSVVLLQSGQHLTGVTFRLLATAVLTGGIADTDGEPISGVQVQILRRGYAPGPRFIPAGFATTNDRGEYRIWGLTPGRYFVAAVYSVAVESGGTMMAIPKTGLEPGRAKEAYVRTFFPGTVDASAAAPIDLGAGEEQRVVQFAMVVAPMVRVHGRALNLVNARGPRGTTIQLSSRTQGAGLPFVRRAVVNDDQGNFEIPDVLPGAYALVAQWTDGANRYYAQQAIDVGMSDVGGVTVAVIPGRNLTGRVRTETAAGVDLASLHVEVRPRDALPAFAGSVVPVNADGTFSLTNLPPGVFDVYVLGGPDGTYLKSARWGAQDTFGAGLIVTPEETAGVLDVVVRRSAAVVGGVVLDAQQRPAAGVTVALIPESDRRARTDFYWTATTDDRGRFDLSGVSPGTYAALAWSSIEAGAFMDADFLQPFEGRARRLAVGETGHVDADLTVIVTR